MFGQQQHVFSIPSSPPAILRRETTNEIGAIYTTLFDDQPQDQDQDQDQGSQEFAQSLINSGYPSSAWAEQQFQTRQQSPLLSPSSPCYSTFSSSSSPSPQSSNSSPAMAGGATNSTFFRNMDAEEADELSGLFNITIEDLLSGNTNTLWSTRDEPIQAQVHTREQLIHPTYDFALFGTAATQQPCHSQQGPQHYEPQALQFGHNNIPVAQPHFGQCYPEQSSLSPQQQLQSSYFHQLQQHHQQQKQHYHALQSIQHQQVQHQLQQQQQQQLCFSSQPNSPTAQTVSTPSSPHFSNVASFPSTPLMGSIDTLIKTECSSSTSSPQVSNPLSPSRSPSSMPPSSPATPADSFLFSMPGTDGMHVVRSQDGSIMVLNPVTEALSFRCEFCPEESYGRIHDLKRHQASKHQAMTWPCDYCLKPFARRDALLRHYTVKSARDDGIHPNSEETEELMAARARAKLI